jgi:SpoVK/Ycf46/Vps4 family AAA+-type ATPase
MFERLKKGPASEPSLDSGPKTLLPEPPKETVASVTTPITEISSPMETKKAFSFHQTKDIIEQARIKYQQELGNHELPPITFLREGNSSKIRIDLTDNVDLFSVMMGLSKTIGEAEISSSLGILYLAKKDGMRVWIAQPRSIFPGSIEFSKDKDLEPQEIEAVINVYKLANPLTEKTDPRKDLESLGATIFNPAHAPDWEYLAGYENTKEQVTETVINSLKHPEVYEQIARKTRKTFESNQPRAVLFEGPPGTGKTTMARVIAGEVDAVLVYVPIESIMTKWYGESGNNLAKIFKACEALGNTILFLDEIDSLATTRDGDIHEETRRVLSVLLRNIDGFNSNEKTILIGATNRKNDLDPALLSRFDTSIEFPLPDVNERQAIFANYANHLSQEDLAILAQKGEGLSGRDIKKLCERMERNWASTLIKNEQEVEDAPPLSNYLALVEKNK